MEKYTRETKAARLIERGVDKLLNQSQKQIDEQSFNYTDLGNAERFAYQHGQYLRFVFTKENNGYWLVWDGKRWKADELGEVYQRAKQTVRSIDDREWQMKSESKARISNMIELAKSEEGIPISRKLLDQDKYLFNVNNGTLNLQDFTISSHSQEDHITMLAPVDYDETASCPMFMNFLRRIFKNDEEMIDFMQRAIGYALTGDTNEDKLFFLYGSSGNNGKTTFLNIIRALLGDYAKQTPPSTIMKKDTESTHELARLVGSRFVSSSETEEDKHLAEALIKQLTGGDPLHARKLYENGFEFYPTFKLFIATNHKPRISETRDAIWRRICLLPFEVKIPDSEVDKSLEKKIIQNELSGILNWAIEGCMKWKMSGLTFPVAIQNATNEYREEMDILGRFLKECCQEKPGAKIKSSILYDAYKDWVEEQGHRPVSHIKFSQRLEERGIEKKRENTGVHFLNISILYEASSAYKLLKSR